MKRHKCKFIASSQIWTTLVVPCPRGGCKSLVDTKTSHCYYYVDARICEEFLYHNTLQRHCSTGTLDHKSQITLMKIPDYACPRATETSLEDAKTLRLSLQWAVCVFGRHHVFLQAFIYQYISLPMYTFTSRIFLITWRGACIGWADLLFFDFFQCMILFFIL